MADYRNTRISPLSSLRFVPEDDAKGIFTSSGYYLEAYNTWRFDRGLFTNQARTHQTRRRYNYKVQPADYITIFLDSLCDSVDYYFLNEDGSDSGFSIISNAPIGTVAGNTFDPDPEVSITYNSFYAGLWPYDVGLSDGVYYLRIVCNYDDGSVKFISEPFHYRSQPFLKTLRFEYGSTDNDPISCVMYSLITPELVPTLLKAPFMLRVEAFLNDPEGSSTDTTFVAQMHEPRLLKSIPYRRRELMIGADGGIPPYQIDKMDRILSCDTVYSDGQLIVKDDSSKQLSTTKNPDTQMMAAKIYVQEVQESAGWSYTSARAVHILDLPISGGSIAYPFAINFIALNNHSHTLLISEVIIDNGTALTNWLNYLNNVQIPSEGMRGEIVVSAAGAMYYNNALGEAYFALGGTIVCRDYVSYTMYSQGVYKSTLIGIEPVTGGVAALTIYDAGDGSAAVAQQTSGHSIIHTYSGSTANRVMRIFHNSDTTDTAIGVIRTQYNDRCLVRNINTGSTFPSLLKTLDHQYGTQGSSSLPIYTDGLAGARGALQNLFLLFGGGATYANNVFDIFGLDGRTFGTQLTTIFIIVPDGNSAAANAIVQAMNLNVNIGTGGTLIISSNAGTSPLTGAAATIAATWVGSFGWTVYSD
ncbi:hypothetical protein UFOVP74_34 [uncultured Caudovirales phage]|uniref:Uncharacterized protein n=1 Tax=uncultured Caudovirales phage TaxID=2100421 RepID=A0A6J5L204_9CAUD|nr:hypothetical protein UFOVP74_34 [uncultured Caudovirales phage]